MAGAYNGLDQREEAEIWYLRAIATNQDNQDFYSVALNYMNIAGFYADGRQYEKAEDYYQKGETLARSYDYKNILQDLLAKRAGYWAERGEYSRAYQDQVAYEAVKDSIFNKTKAEAIAEAETRYNTERKERELAENKVALTQEQLKVQRQRTYSITLASVLLLVGLSSVGIIRQQRQKRRQLEREADLKEQLAKVEMQRKMEEERMRISRDLHDHIGAQLTIMGAQIDKMAFNEESEVSRAELEKISDHARDTMAQLRETIWAMSNDSIELDMLVAKLRDFLNRISWDQRSYQIEYEIEKSLTLGPGQAINLFRVCQEGVQNALKYADFKRLSLSFRQTDGYLSVRLEDDGVGISDLNIAKGYGIKNMAGRMKQVGGEFQIRRGKEKGTCLEFKLPLNTTSAV